MMNALNSRQGPVIDLPPEQVVESPQEPQAKPKPRRPWFRLLANRYMERQAERGVKQVSIGFRGGDLIAFADWIKHREVTREGVAQWLTQQHQSGKRNGGSCNAILGAIKACLASAVYEGLLDKNPLLGMKPLFPPTPMKTDRFTAVEYRKLKEATLGTRLYPMVVILYNTGMRISDCIALKWGSIDFETQMVRLKPKKTVNRTGVEVTVPFTSGSDLCELLNTMRESLGSAPKDDDRLFDFPPDETVDYEKARAKLSEDFNKVRKKLNIRGRSFHSFRRSFLTNLASSGCDTVTLMHMTGITCLSTLKHYIVPSAEAMRRALEKAREFSEQL